MIDLLLFITSKISMLHFDILSVFILTAMGFTLVPGPDMLYVLTQSVTSGWQKGFTTATGLVTGLIIHTLSVAFGLGYVLESFPLVIVIIKVIGAVYLIYLAYLLWRQRQSKGVNTIVKKEFKKDFTTGFIMNLTNPKVSLFFLGFFPAFRFHDKWSVTCQFLLLGVLFMLQALLVFFIVAFFSDRFGRSYVTPKKQLYWNKIQALLLLFIVVILLLS